MHTANRDKMLADIKVALGGFVAEKIKYGVTSSGVASDFAAATHGMARVLDARGRSDEALVLVQSAVERDPEIAELFAQLDAGWKLPKHDEHAVDPSNVEAETRIVRHLLREQLEQCAARRG